MNIHDSTFLIIGFIVNPDVHFGILKKTLLLFDNPGLYWRYEDTTIPPPTTSLR